MTTPTPSERASGGESVWEGHTPSTRGYRRLLLGLFMAGLATFAQLYSPQGLLPLIAADLDISADQSSLLISSATLGLALSVIPWSFVGDKLGRKKAMGIAIVAASVFAIAAMLSPEFEWMIVFRGLEGLSLGGVPALAIAYLNEEVHPSVAAQSAGTYVAGTVVGGLIGRVVATPISELIHWRAGMAAVVVLAVVAAVGFLILSPEARLFTPHSTTLRKAIVQVTGNLKSPVLIVMYLQGFLLMGGFVAVYNYLGFHLSGAPYYLPVWVISFLFFAYLIGTWTSPWAGKMANRYGPSRVLMVMTSLMVVSVLGTLVANLWVVLAALIVFTGAFFGAHAVASGWAGSAAIAGRAQSSALYNLFYYSGSSFFGWLGGIFLAKSGWAGTASMVAILTGAAFVLVLLIYLLVVVPRQTRVAKRQSATQDADALPNE